MVTMTSTDPRMAAPLAATVRRLADDLHDALRAEMTRQHTAPEVVLLWHLVRDARDVGRQRGDRWGAHS
jgi:hypothetical protein